MKYDFENPDHFAELTRQAYAGTVDVSGFPPAAYRYFDSLRRLYAAYRGGEVDADAANQRKARLLEDYRQTAEAYQRWRNVYRAYSAAIRQSELLLSEIEKAADIAEIADKACRAIALMTGDSSFYDRQHKKIESG
jgi:hypothetical protein